jgi:L-aminopeptidase/D-esterase-like protein
MRMKRREFSRALAGVATGAALLPLKAASENPGGSITDVQGVKVGHYTESRRPTGCTVVLFEKGATAGVDVRGPRRGRARPIC